jgi:hypothetical protein
MCGTCVGRPGNLMSLDPGRLAELVAVNRARESYLVCHATQRDGLHPQAGEALCRWFYDLPRPAAFIQVMRLLGAFREVDPPGEDTADEHR